MHVHLWPLCLVDQSFTIMHTPESTSMALARVKILIHILMNALLLIQFQAILMSNQPNMWMLLKKNVVNYTLLFSLFPILRQSHFCFQLSPNSLSLYIYISYQQALVPLSTTLYQVHILEYIKMSFIISIKTLCGSCYKVVICRIPKTADPT